MSTWSDPLAALSTLPGVTDAATAARESVDALLWDRGVRANGQALARESILRGAVANAAFEGAEADLEAVRSFSATDSSAVGRVIDAALRLHEAVPGLVATFRRSPAEALAAAHLNVARGFADEALLGRPRRDDTVSVDDPLRLGSVPRVDEVDDRLTALWLVLSSPTAAPAVVVAAVVHAELAWLRPFSWGSGLVARATTRWTLASRGVDPDGLAVPEAGLMMLGRPAYVTALRGYASGTPDGVAAWIVHHSNAIRLGSTAATS